MMWCKKKKKKEGKKSKNMSWRKTWKMNMWTRKRFGVRHERRLSALLK